MKRRYFVAIMLIAVVLGGCTVSEDMEDRENNSNTVTSSIGEKTDKLISEGEASLNEEAISDVTHLKVNEFSDYAPFYSISFQKIEGETGELLLFEGSTETDNQQLIIPVNLRVEPEEAVWELSYCFDGNDNLTDTVTLEFWNRGNAGSYMIEIDSLQYELKLPEVDSEMITLNQMIEPLDITIKNVVKYSKALLFELEGVEKNEYMFLLSDENGNKIAPTRVAHTPEEDWIQLLYVFENPIGDESWSMNIKDLANQSEGKSEYVECKLTF